MIQIVRYNLLHSALQPEKQHAQKLYADLIIQLLFVYLLAKINQDWCQCDAMMLYYWKPIFPSVHCGFA